MPKNIFLITSEVSGDLISSFLIRELLIVDPSLKLTAIAGEKTEKAGAELLASSSEMGSMRIGWVPLLQIYEYYKQRRLLKQKALKHLKQNQIDLVILVDLNGFSAFFLKYLVKYNVPYVCYIPSQEWVMEKFTKQMLLIQKSKAPVFSIFPEENRFYQERKIKSEYLGHPLVDICQDTMSREEAIRKIGLTKNQKIVTLLPLSRKQEVSSILPVILETALEIRKIFPKVKFVFSLARLDLRELINKELAKYPELSLVFSTDNYAAIKAADLVIAKSGTVNLETALMNVPQIVFYKINPLSAFFVKSILRIKMPKFISAVNLLYEKKIVPEFVQEKANPKTLSYEAIKVLSKTSSERMSYEGLREIMGDNGSVKRVAKRILKLSRIV